MNVRIEVKISGLGDVFSEIEKFCKRNYNFRVRFSAHSCNGMVNIYLIGISEKRAKNLRKKIKFKSNVNLSVLEVLELK